MTPVFFANDIAHKSHLNAEVQEFHPRNLNSTTNSASTTPSPCMLINDEGLSKPVENVHVPIDESKEKVVMKEFQKKPKSTTSDASLEEAKKISKKSKQKRNVNSLSVKINNQNDTATAKSTDLSYADILGVKNKSINQESPEIKETVPVANVAPPSPPSWHTVVKSKGKKIKNVKVNQQQQDDENWDLETSTSELSQNNSMETSITSSSASTPHETSTPVLVPSTNIINTIPQSKKSTTKKNKKSKKRNSTNNHKMSGFEVTEPIFAIKIVKDVVDNLEEESVADDVVEPEDDFINDDMGKVTDYSDEQLFNAIDLKELEDELDKDFDIIESVSELSSDDNDTIATEVLIVKEQVKTVESSNSLSDVIYDIEEEDKRLEIADNLNVLCPIENVDHNMEKSNIIIEESSTKEIANVQYIACNERTDDKNQQSEEKLILNSDKTVLEPVMKPKELVNLVNEENYQEIVDKESNIIKNVKDDKKLNGFVDHELISNGLSETDIDDVVVEEIIDVSNVKDSNHIVHSETPHLANGCLSIDSHTIKQTKIPNGNITNTLETNFKLNNNNHIQQQNESIQCDNNLETEKSLFDNNQPISNNSFPITEAVSKWLKEQKEKSPEPVLRLPDDPVLSLIQLSAKNRSNYLCDNQLISDDNSCEWTTTDDDETDIEDEVGIASNNKNRPKNLKSNPLHASSPNYNHFLDTDSDYMSDSQFKYDEIACERVAPLKSEKSKSYKIIPKHPQNQDINFNLDNKASTTNINGQQTDDNIEIYESLYGKTINYENLLSETDPMLSNNIISENHSEQLRNRNKNNNHFSKQDNNNVNDNSNNLNDINSTNNADNCIKLPFTEHCCMLM